MKISNYNQFLLEWGYGGEGGVASKDPIKVKSSMITNIDLEDEEDKDDDKDIPILQDNLIKEGIDEIKQIFGDVFIVEIYNSNEFNLLLKFFEEHGITWANGNVATSSNIFYPYIYFNCSLTRKNTIQRGNSPPQDMKNKLLYSVDQILNTKPEKNVIKWYNKGKFIKENVDKPLKFK